MFRLPTESEFVFRKVVVVVVAVFLALPTLAAVASSKSSFSLPEQASEVAPGVFFLGHAVQDGVTLVGYAYAWMGTAGERGRRANGKPVGTPGGGGGNGGGGNETESSCYSYIANGAKWNSAEPYVFNSANQNIGNVTLGGTDGVFGAWESASGGANIVEVGNPTTLDLVADTSSTDGANEIYFASIPDANVLGYTIVWSTRSRGRNAGQIVEADMVIDDDDWNWYTGSGAAGSTQIDFWSVFTHEAGHWVGMGHTDTTVLCSGQTMYPYVSYGDSTKRALGAGDIAGVSALYD